MVCFSSVCKQNSLWPMSPWFSAFLIQPTIQISRVNVMATLKEQFDEINFHPPLNSDFREKMEYKGEKESKDRAVTRDRRNKGSHLWKKPKELNRLYC